MNILRVYNPEFIVNNNVILLKTKEMPEIYESDYKNVF